MTRSQILTLIRNKIRLSTITIAICEGRCCAMCNNLNGIRIQKRGEGPRKRGDYYYYVTSASSVIHMLVFFFFLFFYCSNILQKRNFWLSASPALISITDVSCPCSDKHQILLFISISKICVFVIA